LRHDHPTEPHTDNEQPPDTRSESRYAPREYRPEPRYVPAPTRSSPADYASERQRARILTRGADADYGANEGPPLKLPPSIAAVFGPRRREEPRHQPADVEPQQVAPERPADEPAVQPGAHADAGQGSMTSVAEPQTPAAVPEAEDPEFTTVLKSGVVDGLAYTLYADGSIAAELPEGRRRFASIDELRAHLEQNGG
jgi:hypothetical protein